MLEDLVTLAVDEFSVWNVVLADAAKLINDEVLVVRDNCGKSIWIKLVVLLLPFYSPRIISFCFLLIVSFQQNQQMALLKFQETLASVGELKHNPD